MTSSRTRLTTDQKMRALAYIARGDTMSQVAASLLADFDVTISESALYQIKRNHADTISKMQDSLADSQMADAEHILRRSRVLLAKKMQRAEADGAQLDELDEQYRNGEIKVEDYRRKKAGLLRISISELLNISKGMFAQTVKQPGDAALPPGGAAALPPGGSTPAQLEALLQSIKSGNTVEMQRLIFNPQGPAKNDQPLEVSQ